MIRLAFAAALVALACLPAPAADLATIASKHVGLHERTDRTAIRRLVGVDPVRTPWCGAYMRTLVREAGFQAPAGALRAYSWTRFGRKASTWRRGDVAVIKTRRGYHVTVIQKVNGRCIDGIGGNQSNRVKVSRYCRVVAVRRPR